MSQARISVAMCTYNGARFLQEQLESIASQGTLPQELVVCDDHSSDGSPDIVRAFARHAPFAVHLEVNHANLGSTRNFEKAISLCQGEIVALADQDDIWYHGKLTRIADVLGRFAETVAVFSDADLIDEDSRLLPGSLWNSASFSGKEQERFANGQALSVLLKHPVVTGAAMAFRAGSRSLFMPIPANHPVHDYWISFLLAVYGKIQAIPDILMQYRIHANQQIGPGSGRFPPMERIAISRNTDAKRIQAESEGLRQIRDYLSARRTEFPYSEPVIELFTEKISHFSVRAGLAKSRLLRVPAVFREITSLRYWRYSGGWKSVAQDAFLRRA